MFTVTLITLTPSFLAVAVFEQYVTSDEKYSETIAWTREDFKISMAPQREDRHQVLIFDASMYSIGFVVLAFCYASILKKAISSRTLVQRHVVFSMARQLLTRRLRNRLNVGDNGIEMEAPAGRLHTEEGVDEPHTGDGGDQTDDVCRDRDGDIGDGRPCEVRAGGGSGGGGGGVRQTDGVAVQADNGGSQAVDDISNDGSGSANGRHGDGAGSRINDNDSCSAIDESDGHGFSSDGDGSGRELDNRLDYDGGSHGGKNDSDVILTDDGGSAGGTSADDGPHDAGDAPAELQTDATDRQADGIAPHPTVRPSPSSPEADLHRLKSPVLPVRRPPPDSAVSSASATSRARSASWRPWRPWRSTT